MTALYIILGIIALIVILFSIKVSVTAEYADSFSLDVQWLFIKLHIFPQTEEQKAKREAKKAKKEEKKKRAYVRTPLILALLGLATSFVFGGGMVLSVPAVCLSLTRLRTSPSRTLRWAAAVSAVATIFSVFVFALSLYFLALVL